jgi:integrase
VYSIYSTVSALFRDAKLADKIKQTPCCLDERQLGPLVDKDPEWRATAIFTRDEVETLISHPEIPLDRRIVYALELLAGVRTGEAAALRWRHYDPTKQPLGELLVAVAYSTLRSREKTTKTDSSKHIPVHPTLAAMLAEWKRRSAFDGYNRGLQWERTCAEVAKLKISRRTQGRGAVIALPVAAGAEGAETADGDASRYSARYSPRNDEESHAKNFAHSWRPGEAIARTRASHRWVLPRRG